MLLSFFSYFVPLRMFEYLGPLIRLAKSTVIAISEALNILIKYMSGIDTVRTSINTFRREQCKAHEKVRYIHFVSRNIYFLQL